MARKYKIIQTLFSSNFIYRVRYMIKFFFFYGKKNNSKNINNLIFMES